MADPTSVCLFLFNQRPTHSTKLPAAREEAEARDRVDVGRTAGGADNSGCQARSSPSGGAEVTPDWSPDKMPHEMDTTDTVQMSSTSARAGETTESESDLTELDEDSASATSSASETTTVDEVSAVTLGDCIYFLIKVPE